MMRFELGLEEPDPGRALRSALTIALAYVLDGLVPLSPYIFASGVLPHSFSRLLSHFLRSSSVVSLKPVTRELRLSEVPFKPLSSALSQLVLHASSPGGFPSLASRSISSHSFTDQTFPKGQ